MVDWGNGPLVTMVKDALYVVANKVLAATNAFSSYNRGRSFGVWWRESPPQGKKFSVNLRP